MSKKKIENSKEDVTENPLFHDTWKLLENYRKVVWSLELSIQQVRRSFEVEYKSTIDAFLDSIYSAGIEFEGTNIERHTQCIEKSNKMLKLIDSSIDLMRRKHINGEGYYWVLYYSYLAKETRSIVDIVEMLRPKLDYISYRTYYRLRREAIEVLSSVLWGYTSKDCLELLERFFPE